MNVLVLPVPPSSNVYWRKWQNRMVRSPDAKAYIEAVALVATPHRRRYGWPLIMPVAVSFRWFRAKAAGDLDNRLKVALDALQGVAYVNDGQVRRLDAELFDTDKRNPRLEVTVTPYLTPAPDRREAA